MTRDWPAANAMFLSDKVAWVRARLAALAKDQLPDERAKVAAVSGAEARQAEHVPAFTRLAIDMGLSAFEQDILALCIAAALDSSVGALCAAASNDPGKPYPTFALAMRISDGPAWEALAPLGALRYWRLIEIHQGPSEPLIAAALRADERIVNYVKGLNHVDDRLATLVRPPRPGPTGAPLPSQAAIYDRIHSLMLAEEKLGLCPVVQLLGPGGAAKGAIAHGLSQRLGCTLWHVSARSLPDVAGDLDTFARLLRRESALLRMALHIECDDDDAAGITSSLLPRLVDRLDGMLVFLAVRDPLPGLNRPSLHEFAGKPTMSEQRDIWLRLLGPGQTTTAGVLAGQFNLDAATIERIKARGEGTAEIALWREARDAVRPRVLGLAERIDAKARWDDLVLPQQQVELLKEMAAQVRHRWTVYQQWGFAARANRGLGIAAMFCGASGTGKNMAAEVIARHAELDLYRIDLASVVSKYIGETEKNLRRVFDAFEDGGAILFFDEADALFGKRSDVKDSHDRYANIEVNYLLQRMEAYRGLVILATNRRSGMDQAFMRRLRFIVDFPYPGIAERTKIWQRVFPESAPTDILDVERLSRLTLSGGNIQSVAMNAAFRAASEKRKVSTALILDCARAELKKLDLPINEAEFRSKPELRRSA